MAIQSTDIKFRGSTTSGSAGNTVATTAPSTGTNLGKYITSTDLVDATLNNLFPDVTGDENFASNVDHQCMFVYNAHGSLTLQNAVVWVVSQVANGAAADIGLDTTSASAVGSSSAQAVTTANKQAVPSGVTFTTPTSKSTGLSIGNLASGTVKAIWVRRTSSNQAAINNDGLTLRVEGDTAA